MLREQQPKLSCREWFGPEAENPQRPGEKMCGNIKLLEAAEKAGLPRDEACSRCLVAAGCAYLAQSHMIGVDVWVVPHHMLFLEPFGCVAASGNRRTAGADDARRHRH